MSPIHNDQIEYVSAFSPQNSKRYTIKSPMFCDSTGDGVVAFLAGAAFRMGAERDKSSMNPWPRVLNSVAFSATASTFTRRMHDIQFR
jgi:hypothetical protein